MNWSAFCPPAVLLIPSGASEHRRQSFSFSSAKWNLKEDKPDRLSPPLSTVCSSPAPPWNTFLKCFCFLVFILSSQMSVCIYNSHFTAEFKQCGICGRPAGGPTSGLLAPPSLCFFVHLFASHAFSCIVKISCLGAKIVSVFFLKIFFFPVRLQHFEKRIQPEKGLSTYLS